MTWIMIKLQTGSDLREEKIVCVSPPCGEPPAVILGTQFP